MTTRPIVKLVTIPLFLLPGILIGILCYLMVPAPEGRLLPLAKTRQEFLRSAEAFPFSSFPMYARFAEDAFIVYLADKDGEPLPVQHLTFERTSALKKIYDQCLREQAQFHGTNKSSLTPEQCRPCGDLALAWLWENASRPGAQDILRPHLPLQLFHVEMAIVDGRPVHQEPILVGTFSPDAP